MEVMAVGAMKALLPKLGELLKDEYNLGKRVRKGVRSLETELTMMHAALRKVAEVPRDQLDEQVRIWAGKVRELSYDMEDAIDAFMVDRERELAANSKSMVKRFVKKTKKLLSKGKALRPIADAIKEAQGLAEELAALRQRYGLELHYSSSSGATIDPRLTALYSEVTELVGIDDTREELITMLTEGAHDESMQQLKTISIVGFGGLGKTTIAKVVYEKIKEQFHCAAFVSVSRNPDITKIFKKMLHQLDKVKYANTNEWDETQLIDELREFLRDKRYFIIIDDIWDEKLWEYIKCAFSKNNLGSRLITTTRNVNVSKACCSSKDDISYEMKPLSVDDSKRLFYKRIFSQDNECPHELEDISKDILKKCGGVPLAIITIASLLANKEIQTKDQWNTLCNSIGHGLTEGAKVEDMQMILSFSYYDLPSHLKPCLLYLSIFPEDYEIRRDRLIWRWIAEGFVQHDKKGDSEFELGENYFNELINRSMIQTVEIDAEGKAKACRVHDMVLDLIYHLSSEENFVTILDGLEQNISSQRKVRRLSLQSSMTELTTPQATTSMSQVRSFTIFSSAINLMPSLSCFHVIRVLDLEGCDLGQSSHLNLGYVKFLFHLRYLGLRRTYIEKLGEYVTRDTYVVRELPTEIENLQFLQTLDIGGAGIKELPPAIVRLRRLKCLHFSDMHGTRLPDGFGNLTSLEELSRISTKHYADVVKELSQLTKLRVLEIMWGEMDERMATAFVGCLGNLTKLQSLDIYASGRGNLNLMREGWVPPPELRRFRSKGSGGPFSTLPTWINSSLHISSLHIWVDEIGWEDIQILGTLPALRSLFLATSRSEEEHAVKRFVVGAGAFQCARECSFIWFVTVPSMFPQGAMPRVRFLKFYLRAQDFANGDLDSRCLHMGHLPSLEHVEVSLCRGKVRFGQLMELEVALTRAADVHPNHPTISIQRMGEPSDKETEWEYHLSKTAWEHRMMKARERGTRIFPGFPPAFPRFPPTSASR